MWVASNPSWLVLLTVIMYPCIVQQQGASFAFLGFLCGAVFTVQWFRAQFNSHRTKVVSRAALIIQRLPL